MHHVGPNHAHGLLALEKAAGRVTGFNAPDRIFPSNAINPARTF